MMKVSRTQHGSVHGDIIENNVFVIRDDCVASITKKEKRIRPFGGGALGLDSDGQMFSASLPTHCQGWLAAGEQFLRIYKPR